MRKIRLLPLRIARETLLYKQVNLGAAKVGVKSALHFALDYVTLVFGFRTNSNRVGVAELADAHV